ncbi:uncharacterized protein LOC131254962 [Magnolia sinica]|uniref:uncharacterized protein LOC131254962 n=1 Tax=Magnolia sinica TaxID=86752 RepID=UPI00265955BC|nr:uncharacterized protein LOC131254962 [Magnolia sinica]
MAIANKMRIHGNKMVDVTIIEKILRSMTTKFNYVVCSIEESKDTDSMSIDELQSSLLVHEQKMKRQDKEEQALQASTSKGGDQGRGRGRGGNDGRHSNQKSEDFDSQGRGKCHDNNNNHSSPFKSKSADKSRVKCYRCHKFDHYKSKCRTNLRRDGGKQSNFAEKEEVSLLMACHVKEETHKKFLWYLYTGCNNHMSGEKFVFSELDEAFHDVVKFANGSTVSIMGKGKVAIQTNRNSIQTISNVLFVLDLRTNVLSVGELQEKGYGISIKNGVCGIEDEKLGLIAQVNMTTKR